jgi:hypothetical protein
MLGPSWKTSLAGLLAIAGAVCAATAALVTGKVPDWPAIGATIVAGVGLLCAKDHNVTGAILLSCVLGGLSGCALYQHQVVVGGGATSGHQVERDAFPSSVPVTVSVPAQAVTGAAGAATGTSVGGK